MLGKLGLLNKMQSFLETTEKRRLEDGGTKGSNQIKCVVPSKSGLTIRSSVISRNTARVTSQGLDLRKRTIAF